MKKRFLVTLLCVLATLLIAAGCSPSEDEPTIINVYNWGEYIDQSVLDEFYAQTGIEVNYTQYATNEEMYAKLKSGGANYDVVIPSDYMIGRMIKEDMLEKIDFSNIPNYQYVDSNFTNMEYDPQNEYSIPYMWGNVGILYNTKYVDDVVDSWDILWNEKYSGQILMFDNSRDAIGIALKKLGYSYNTTDEAQLRAAMQELEKQKPFVQSYVMDQIFDKMEGEEAYIGPYYAGDAITIMDSNPDIAFAVPKEGTNIFIDAMVIPKDAKNKQAAELFINFMCSAETGLANAEEIGYSTPLTNVMEIMDPEMRENEIAYPSDEVLEKAEVFKNLPQETLDLYDALWVELMS